MFEHILRPTFAILDKTFSKGSKYRKMAGIAFVCLLLSIGCAIATAWISYPVYSGMFTNPLTGENGQKMGLGFSIAIAASMFYFMSTLGYWLAEKLNGLSSLLAPSLIGTVFILGLILGGFDATQGASTGAEVRAKQVFKTQSFAEARAGKALPYQSNIDKIDGQIEALQNDKIRGEMRWGNQKKIDRLITQRDKYVNMQTTELEEMRSDHANLKSDTLDLRATATQNLSWFQACLYFLQIVLTIPLANFDISLDSRDGERDGNYGGDDDDSKKSSGLSSWFQRNMRSKKQDPEPTSAQVENQIGFHAIPGAQSDRNSSREGGKKSAKNSPSQDLAKGKSKSPKSPSTSAQNLSLPRAKTSAKFDPSQGQILQQHSSTNLLLNLNPETPYNLGKKYNMTQHQKKQLTEIRKAYIRYVKKHGKRPLLMELVEKTGKAKATVKKYMGMMEKEGQVLLRKRGEVG